MQEQIDTLGDIMKSQLRTTNSLLDIVSMLKEIVAPDAPEPIPNKIVLFDPKWKK